ncbi:MAG: glycosyltransferase family 2 protein [Nitrospira sp.]|nr:glycosyltransferase family 2 protein [Nitrospira sp.]
MQVRDPVDVSVIIPTYNRARLVAESIESVLRQTRPPREIIVVDDGSTDETRQVLASFGNRIIAIHQDNKGVGGARNSALEVAQGRYLAFLDSDDLWMERKLEWQVAIMEQFPHLGVLFSDFVITGNGGRVRPKGLSTWFHEPLQWDRTLEDMFQVLVPCMGRDEPVALYSGRLYRALLTNCYILPSCAIVRAACVTPDIRFPEDNHHCSDWEFFARLARSYPVGFMDVETTINRGGDEWPRLTRMSAAAKIRFHLRMIESVWKSDAEFLTAHRDEIRRVEADLYLQLAKHHVMHSNMRDARAAIGRWLLLGKLNGWPTGIGVALCAWFPGGGALLRSMRSLMRSGSD